MVKIELEKRLGRAFAVLGMAYYRLFDRFDSWYLGLFTESEIRRMRIRSLLFQVRSYGMFILIGLISIASFVVVVVLLNLILGAISA